MRKNKNFFAFTLAEVMVVLVIIGVLASILLPIAKNFMPDENLNKFLKAHNTFYSAVSELVTSDKYYLNGDMGIKADGNRTDTTYFCESFADVIESKKINCSNVKTDYFHVNLNWPHQHGLTFEYIKNELDTQCVNSVNDVGSEIITRNNIIYYNSSPAHHFCTDTDGSEQEHCGFGRTMNCFYQYYAYLDSNGIVKVFNEHIPSVYKTFCMDIDGSNQGEDPFGYGIRVDGKIFNGARADAWLQKAAQK